MIKNTQTKWKLTAVLLAVVFVAAAPALANERPVADAGPDQNAYVGDLVLLNGSATDPDGDSIAIKQWYFEATPAGSSATIHKVNTYNAIFYPDVAGEYIVAFMVWDSNYLYSLPDTAVITVTGPNNPPTAAPSALPNSGVAPLVVQFTANASDPDGDDLTYAWDFGDSNTSTEADPEHTYESAGAYEVWLTVSDGELEVTESLLITVDSPVVMSVSSAMVKWTKNNNTVGNVHLEADFLAPFPAPDDVVAVLMDVIPLFEAPFADFVLTEEDGEIFYKFKDKNLLVKLDLVGGWLKVIAHKLMLADIDNANGVDVELYISGAAAVENIIMTEAPGRKLIYTRPE